MIPLAGSSGNEGNKIVEIAIGLAPPKTLSVSWPPDQKHVSDSLTLTETAFPIQ